MPQPSQPPPCEAASERIPCFAQMTAFFLKKLTMQGHATAVGHVEARTGALPPMKKRRR